MKRNMRRAINRRNSDTIVFASPFAHIEGHYSSAAEYETAALRDTMRVALVTSQGMREGHVPKVPSFQVVGNAHSTLQRFLGRISKMTVARFPLMFLETFFCLTAACLISGKENAKVIFVCDPDPFLFIPHLLSLFFRQRSWLVSVLGVYGGGALDRKSLISSPVWKPLFRASIAGSRFAYLCQRESIREYYSCSFLGGVLRNNVHLLPPLVAATVQPLSVRQRHQARVELGVPMHDFMLLSFGALHEGKDLRIAISALRKLDGVFLVHAGRVDEATQIYISSMPTELKKRCLVHNRYVPEDKKSSYFFAADAVVLSYKESFLRTSSMLWESCRFGVPVVASRNAQTTELVESYGLGTLFEAENETSLVSAIKQLKSLGELEIGKLRGNCGRFCEDYSAENWSRHVLQIVQQMMNQGQVDGTRNLAQDEMAEASSVVPGEPDDS